MARSWAIYWTVFSLGLCQLQVPEDDPASNQLSYYAMHHPPHQTYIVSDAGQPIDMLTAALTVGQRGPILLQDTTFIENMARFDRERIPERVVHAKGAGAFGYFEVTHDITKYCRARVFEKIGKKTPIAVRFSFVTGEHGTADTIRDPRGFAVKFYTEDGIWDLVGNNTPIFFIRDPSLFPLFIHSQKRNPQTNLRDYNMFWDFITRRPETIHQVMILFSDRGIPDGYRFMHGYGSHTFKVVNKDSVPYYVKFHYRTDQGIRNLSPEKAANLSAVDPDYATRDLFDAIAKKDYPSWTFYIQVMNYEEAEKYRWNPFDVTKVWPQYDFPLIPVGKIVLNENPTNYFADIEQIAFSPANFVPGIEASLDKLLQGRLFSYPDTHRYRLGANYLQLPVNSPYKKGGVTNYNRDGQQVYHNQNGAPNYYPNSFHGPEEVPSAAISAFNVTGEVKRYDTGDEDNFSQPAILWNKVLKPDERERMVKNIADHVNNAAEIFKVRAVMRFAQVSPDMGVMLVRKLGMDPAVLNDIKTEKS